MSYILEALKKAQAERQLGAAPDVHAPTIDAYAARSAARPAWLPAALGGGAACVAIGLALWWRHAAPSVTAPQVATAPAQAVPATLAQPAGAPPVAAAPTTGAQAAGTTPAVASSTAATPLAGAPQATAQSVSVAPPAGAPPSPAVVQPAGARPAGTSPAAPASAAQASAAPPAVMPAPSTHPAAAATAPAPAAPPEPPDESIPTARDLPEPIQRILPAVAMSGYMYSKNPSDRLVLIDKALRREGDEVAPGVVLERLLPKGAVLTFRGYRYRVPYQVSHQ